MQNSSIGKESVMSNDRKETSIQIFNFESFDVRIVDRDGNPWFVVNDVAKCLGMTPRNARDLVSDLDEDERAEVILPTPGGPQKTLIISESGLYHLVGKSRKPEAKNFSRWVRKDILPSIRKTGSYISSNCKSDLHLIKVQNQILQRTIEELIEQREELEKQREELNTVKNDVDVIIKDRKENERQLSLLPESDLEYSKTTRSLLNQRVRTYAKKTGVRYHEIWIKLYTEFYYVYHVNLKLRADRNNMSILDYVESIDMMEELYSLACDVCKPKLKIRKCKCNTNGDTNA